MKVRENIPQEATAWAKEYDRIREVVAGVSYPNAQFYVSPLGDEFSLQVYLHERAGKKVLIATGASEKEVVLTAFQALSAEVLEEATSQFSFKGKDEVL